MTQISSVPKRAAAPAAHLRGYWPLLALAGFVVVAGIVWLAVDAPQNLTGKFLRDRKVIPW